MSASSTSMPPPFSLKHLQVVLKTTKSGLVSKTKSTGVTTSFLSKSNSNPVDYVINN